MILMYVTEGCRSCRKAEEWLRKMGLDYTVKNMSREKLSLEELKFLFTLCEDLYQLVSTRSVPCREFERTHSIAFEEMHFNDMLRFLQHHPNALRRPILTDGTRLQVGFDEEELTVMLPRDRRNRGYSGLFHTVGIRKADPGESAAVVSAIQGKDKNE